MPSSKTAIVAKDIIPKGWPKPAVLQSGDVIPKGWPDGVMALPKGRVIFLELKNKDGSLKEDQVKYQLKLMALGHEWYVVRSFRQFLDIVEGI